MEKKIIRTQTIQGISSRIIQKFDDDITLAELGLKYGKEIILKEIFNEHELDYQNYVKSIKR